MDWDTLKIGPETALNPKEREEIKGNIAGEEIHEAI